MNNHDQHCSPEDFSRVTGKFSGHANQECPATQPGKAGETPTIIDTETTEKEDLEAKAISRRFYQIAANLQRVAGSLIVSLQRLCFLSFVAGMWLWLLFFHSLLFSLSWWILAFLPVLLVLLLPSALLYRQTSKLSDIIELPGRIRGNFQGLAAIKIKAGIGESETLNSAAPTESKGRKKRALFTFFASIREFYRQIELFSHIVETSGFAFSFLNPYSKVLLLITAFVAIGLIVLAGVTFIGYLVILLIF